MSELPRDGAVGAIERWVRSLIATRRATTFLVVGAMGALVDNGVLIALVEGGVLTPVPGAVVSKECSIAFMFVLNERITFADYGGNGAVEVGRRFLTSNLVRVGGAAVGIAVLYGLHTWFGVWYVLANVIGIGFGFLVNYTLESLATWRVQD